MWLFASLLATCIPSRNFMGGARTWQLRACRRVHLMRRLCIRSLLAVFLLNFVFFPHGRRPYWTWAAPVLAREFSLGAGSTRLQLNKIRGAMANDTRRDAGIRVEMDTCNANLMKLMLVLGRDIKKTTIRIRTDIRRVPSTRGNYQQGTGGKKANG